MRHGRNLTTRPALKIPDAYQPFRPGRILATITPSTLLRTEGDPSVLVKPRTIFWSYLNGTTQQSVTPWTIIGSPNWLSPPLVAIDNTQWLNNGTQPDVSAPIAPPPGYHAVIDKVRCFAYDTFGRPLSAHFFRVTVGVALQWFLVGGGRQLLTFNAPVFEEDCQIELEPGAVVAGSVFFLRDTAGVVGMAGMEIRGHFLPFNKGDFL